MPSVQDCLVTLIALGAAAILLRRVLGFAKQGQDAACSHCTSSPSQQSRRGPAQSGATATVMPLHLVRKADVERAR